MAKNWVLNRIELYPSYNLRRVIRVGLERDGNDPNKRVGGVYLRLPSRVYSLLYRPRFTVRES